MFPAHVVAVIRYAGDRCANRDETFPRFQDQFPGTGDRAVVHHFAVDRKESIPHGGDLVKCLHPAETEPRNKDTVSQGIHMLRISTGGQTVNRNPLLALFLHDLKCQFPSIDLETRRQQFHNRTRLFFRPDAPTVHHLQKHPRNSSDYC